MCRYRDNRLCGVLNDFDHAISTLVPISPGSQQRAGTAPYMAIDLLYTSPPPIHLYRHDLESLYYILICVVCPNHPRIVDWFSLRGRRLVHSKRAFLDQPALTPSMGFEGFTKWIAPLHDALDLGYRAASDHENGRQADKVYDPETLGGLVSLDTFTRIFDLRLPTLS